MGMELFARAALLAAPEGTVTGFEGLPFQRPGKLRWEVQAPAASTFVIDGAEITAAFPKLGVVEQISLQSTPELIGVVEGLTVWLRADAASVRTDYDAHWQEGELVLAPKRDDLARWVRRFELTLSEDGRHVARVELFEPDGDRVVMEFTDVRLDGPVESSEFQVR